MIFCEKERSFSLSPVTDAFLALRAVADVDSPAPTKRALQLLGA